MTRPAQATTAMLGMLLLATPAAAQAAPAPATSTDDPVKPKAKPKLELDRARHKVLQARLAAVSRRVRPAVRVRLVRGVRKRRARARRRASRPRPMALQRRQAVGWGGGEAMTYKVRLLGVEIARAAISVGHPRGRQLRLRGRGETGPFVKLLVPLQEDLVTRLDLDGMRPLRTTSRRREGEKRRVIDTVHRRWSADSRRRDALVEQTITRTKQPSAVQRKAASQARPRKARPRQRRLAGPVVDALTALQMVRSMHLSSSPSSSSSKPARLYVLDGTALFEVEFRLAGKDRLHTALGPRDCIRISGVGHRIRDDGRRIKGKRVRRGSIWLTADGGRVPVRLEGDTKFGFVNADITSHRPARRGVTIRLPRAPSQSR